MRKLITLVALCITTPAQAQDHTQLTKQGSVKQSASFEKLFARMQVEITANEAYRIALAAKRARK
jgi:hypothetical protein